MRTQHFMSDSLCQHKLMELQLLLERCSTFEALERAHGIFVRRRHRLQSSAEGMYAPACVRLRCRCAFGCAARRRQGKPSHAAHVHSICICICAVCVHLCAKIATQAPPFSRPPATHFMSACHQMYLPSVKSALSCKRLVLISLRLLLLLQETRWLNGQAS